MRTLFSALIVLLVALSACSLIVDKNGDQCTSNADCSRFRAARCDLALRVCVAAAGDLPDVEGGSLPEMPGAGDGSTEGATIVPDASVSDPDAASAGDVSMVNDVGPKDAAIDVSADVTPDAAHPVDAAEEAPSDPCRGPAGCYRCPPITDLEYENACTNAICVPFDNRARLKHLPPDGGLTPLPEAGPAPLTE
jgi:hypothetical protein